MTPEQIDKVNALSQCRFLPGSWDKRFVRNLAATTKEQPDKELTPKQVEWLDKMTTRYRRQLANGN